MTTTINDSSGPWREYIRAMDLTLAEANATAAVRAWRNAYVAALGTLGDRTMVAQCIRVAESLAALNGDASEAARVRELAANLADRHLRALREEAVP